MVNPTESDCSNLNQCGNHLEWDSSTGLAGNIGATNSHQWFNELKGDGKRYMLLEPDYKGVGEDAFREEYFICMCDLSG